MGGLVAPDDGKLGDLKEQDMSDTSARFGLPLLAAGQAQKEIFHNEALTILETLVQPVAQTLGDNDPPATPQEGESWIVGASPTGAWAGQAGAVGTWTSGGWRFITPLNGMAMWVEDQGVPARYSAGAWQPGIIRATALLIEGAQVVGSQQPAIAAPEGGAIVDTQARAAISAMLTALRAHGLIAA